MKGAPIQFIAGKYAGKNGWIDIDGKERDETTPVIVNLQKKEEKSTYVSDSNFQAKPTGFPSSYTKAVIQQCPDLQKLLVSTCRGFAKDWKDNKGGPRLAELYGQQGPLLQD